MKFKPGQRVKLKANPEEGFAEEFGEIMTDESHGMYIVQLDDKYMTDENDDGVREVDADQLEELP